MDRHLSGARGSLDGFAGRWNRSRGRPRGPIPAPSSVIGPGRSSRGGSAVRSRTVDSRPTVGRPAVDDQVDPAVEIGEHVLGPGR